MDFIGVGIAVIFGFLAFAVKEMPPPLAWGGVALGVVIVLWKHIPLNAKYNGPLLMGAIIFVLAVAAAAWAIAASKQPNVQMRRSQEEVASSKSRSVIQVDKGANVEGAKIFNSRLRGFDNLAHISGTMKGFTADNVDMDANGVGPSTVNGDSGYFGPPRTWVIPEKLWTFTLDPEANKDGTFTVTECAALRGGFFPKTMIIKISGKEIGSASVTRYQSDAVLDAAPAKNGVVILKVSPPEAHYTFGIHIILNKKDSKTSTAFEFP